jgi:hypothetical protein
LKGSLWRSRAVCHGSRTRRHSVAAPGARRSLSTLRKTGPLARAPSVASSSQPSSGTIQAHPIDSLFRRTGRRVGQCGSEQSAGLPQASQVRRSMAIDVGRGAAPPPVAFLLTPVEAAEDKASEKLIALPDRPAKALLAERACDRRPLVMTCRGTASGRSSPPKSNHEAHIFPDKNLYERRRARKKGNTVLPNGSVTPKYRPSSFG